MKKRNICRFEKLFAYFYNYVSIVYQYSIYYRLQTKLREGNVFTSVCDSVHGGGACLVSGVCSGGSLLGGGVPAPGGSAPGGADWWRPPPTATAAGGTHPTGMHSC